MKKSKKKYYYKIVSKVNPQLYYDPEKHKPKSKLLEPMECGVNGCTMKIKGLYNLARHQAKCREKAEIELKAHKKKTGRRDTVSYERKECRKGDTTQASSLQR